MKTKKGSTLIEALVGLTILLIIIGMISLAIIQPFMESRAYNKLTGSKTTWWDAVWIELRIQDTPKS